MENQNPSQNPNLVNHLDNVCRRSGNVYLTQISCYGVAPTVAVFTDLPSLTEFVKSNSNLSVVITSVPCYE